MPGMVRHGGTGSGVKRHRSWQVVALRNVAGQGVAMVGVAHHGEIGSNKSIDLRAAMRSLLHVLHILLLSPLVKYVF